MSRTLAKGIASAMLAGDWDEAHMLARVAEALAVGPSSKSVRALVRFARTTFPEAPRDQRDGLARRLWASAEWQKLPLHRLRIRRPFIDIPEMRETRFEVPAAPTTGDLAALLGMPVQALVALADRRNLSRFAKELRLRHYHHRWMPKPSGGVRLLEIPKVRLRRTQRLLLDRVLTHVPLHPCAHGFRRGRSVFDFVRPHVGQHVVLRIDLQDFFPNIFASRVNAVWRALGYPEEVSRVLSSLTTHATPPDVIAQLAADSRTRLRTPHLPQGAPTSPALANLVAFGLDVRLSALAAKVGGVYGRYADDLAISGGESLARNADRAVVMMMGIAMDEGFHVNPRKTRVQRRSVRQSLAGIVLNTHLAWPRDERKRFEAVLVNCARHGPETQNRAGLADFRGHLLGRLSWLEQVQPAAAERLRRVFETIVWPAVNRPSR